MSRYDRWKLASPWDDEVEVECPHCHDGVDCYGQECAECGGEGVLTVTGSKATRAIASERAEAAEARAW
jgi:hypothetical protein